MTVINSFDQLNIPLIGVIENMAGFTVPETEEIYHIFGEGKGKELALRFNTDLLGRIPLVSEIRRGGDEGYPSACHLGDNKAGLHFHEAALTFLETIQLYK